MEVSQVAGGIGGGPRSSEDQEQPEATCEMWSSANGNDMIVKGTWVDAERSGQGARIGAGQDIGSFLVDRSTKGAVWGGVVPTLMKLAADTGAPGEELPPPTAFRCGKTSDCLS